MFYKWVLIFENIELLFSSLKERQISNLIVNSYLTHILMSVYSNLAFKNALVNKVSARSLQHADFNNANFMSCIK